MAMIVRNAFIPGLLKRSASMGSSGVVMARCQWCSHQKRPTDPSVAATLMIVRGKQTQKKSKRSQSSNTWLERQQKDPYVARAQNEGVPSRAYFKLQEINDKHFPTLLSKKKNKNGKGSNSQNREQKCLFQPDMLVLDLGAAPGGWSLYASSQLNPSVGGAVVAVDLLLLDETLRTKENIDVYTRIESNLQSNFHFIQGDFTHSNTRTEIVESFAHMSCNKNNEDEVNERRPNLILSDMASNFTGDSQTDAIRTLNLCEQALAFAAGSNCFDSSYSTMDNLGMLASDGTFICKYFSCGRENEADLMESTRRAFRSVHTVKPKASRKESSEMYLLALGFKGK